MGNPIGHYFKGPLIRDAEDIVSKLPGGDTVWFPYVPQDVLGAQRIEYQVGGRLTTQEFIGYNVRAVEAKRNTFAKQ